MITLSTPFAGKEHCFDQYCRGIKNLDWPKSDIFYLVIDNSNSPEFGAKIDAFAKKMKFGGYRRYVYEKPHYTIENTSDYQLISKHVHNIYIALQERLPNNEFTFNIEDDVEIPPDSLKKSLQIFQLDPKIGTVVGKASSRRLKDKGAKNPVAWKFQETSLWPYGNISEVIPVPFTVFPPFGIHIIGAAHMCCWLTKTALIKDIGFNDLCGLDATDIAWGYKLNKAGYYFVIDWSITTKHWWLDNGEVGYY